jgi:hypothetical protein
MSSIVQNEAVTASNPQVFFVLQLDGKNTDVLTLSRRVRLVNADGTFTTVIADAALNITDAPAGTRIAKGVYHANFTATSYSVGTYDITWTYTYTGSATLTATQRFEVLDPAYFNVGGDYVGYADSVEMRKISPFDTKTIGEVQVAINRASKRIEAFTSRFFEPRFAIKKIDGRNTRALLLGEPIIGISKVELETGINGLDISVTEIDMNGLRVRNRHLSGLIDPDDRDNPAIEVERFEGLVFQSFAQFPKGPMTCYLTGVFGYTDYNRTPFGKIPDDLFIVVGNYATKFLMDPFMINKTIWTSTSGNVTEMQTRDQRIKFGVNTSTSSSTVYGAASPLTGDAQIDQILVRYLRPPHLSAV